MSDTPEALRTEAEKRRLQVILAEIELAITLQRLAYSEHSIHDHGDAVESLARARHLLSQVPDPTAEMWRALDNKITELEKLLPSRAS